MELAAIIAAAGSGTRLGADKPKALVELNGAPLVVHAIRSMLEADISNIVVTIPGEFSEEFHAIIESAGFPCTIANDCTDTGSADRFGVRDTLHGLTHGDGSSDIDDGDHRYGHAGDVTRLYNGSDATLGNGVNDYPAIHEGFHKDVRNGTRGVCPSLDAPTHSYMGAVRNSVPSARSNIVVTPGGATRQGSVSVGLTVAHRYFPRTTHVLVHDAARALTPASVIRRVYGLLAAGAPGVIPVLPVVDTLKEVVPDPDIQAAAELTQSSPVPAYTETVVGTIERSILRAVQTPQGFVLDVLSEAHRAAADLSEDEQLAAPDDAALVERLGVPVCTVPGDRRALKVTTPFDLLIAQALIAAQSSEGVNNGCIEPNNDGSNS